MATFEKRRIMRKYGKALRPWYFSHFNLVEDGTVEIIGGGLIPDGLMVYKADALKEDNDDYSEMNPVVEPDFITSGTLATGVIESRGQWS